MKRQRLLELITTKYFLKIAIFGTILIITFNIYILKFGIVTIDSLSKFVDLLLKAVALYISALWALNRYFVSRIDTMKLRISNPEINIISMGNSNGQDLDLLSFRFDICNEGNSIINLINLFILVEEISLSGGAISYKKLYRWPEEGMYQGGIIEPGSWSALNDTTLIPSKVKVIRLYLEIYVPNEPVWTWHKTFDVSGEK